MRECDFCPGPLSALSSPRSPGYSVSRQYSLYGSCTMVACSVRRKMNLNTYVRLNFSQLRLHHTSKSTPRVEAGEHLGRDGWRRLLERDQEVRHRDAR